MDDLEKQFFADSAADDLEAQFFAAPQQASDKKRGANFAGAVRNVAQSLPVVGTYADEAEGLVRSLIQGGDYEMWRRNAEESALGNIKNTGYGRTLSIGTNLAGNIGLAALTGGATLLPQVSAAQGFVEGFGRGSGAGDRLVNAGIGGTIGFAIPSIMNRILPTQTVQKAVTNKLAKSSSSVKSIVARALQEGTTPADIIANEVPRGMRPNLWTNMRREFSGENVFRKPILESASANYSMPYEDYIRTEVSRVSPKYASAIGEQINKLKLDELGDDIIGELDPRQYVMSAVNKAMKGATEEERLAVSDAVQKAVAERGVAKKLTSVAIGRPIPTSSGSIWSFLRRGAAPTRNLSNYGLARTLTVGTPAYTPNNMVGRLMNFYTPNSARSAIDAYLEMNDRSMVQ